MAVSFFFSCLVGAGLAASMSTAFTAQGRLFETGQPANGSYDLQFALFNAASGGSTVGTAVQTDAVAVNNGLFAVTLDLGAVFGGNAYWLEIRERVSGAGSWTVLSARNTPSVTSA